MLNCGVILQAASLRVAEQYIQAFGKIAKEVSTTLLDPIYFSNVVVPWDNLTELYFLFLLGYNNAASKFC